MTEDDAEDVSALLAAVLLPYWSACAEVDLGLFARRCFDLPSRPPSAKELKQADTRHSFKVAYFQAPMRGRFSAPTNTKVSLASPTGIPPCILRPSTSFVGDILIERRCGMDSELCGGARCSPPDTKARDYFRFSRLCIQTTPSVTVNSRLFCASTFCRPSPRRTFFKLQVNVGIRWDESGNAWLSTSMRTA